MRWMRMLDEQWRWTVAMVVLLSIGWGSGCALRGTRVKVQRTETVDRIILERDRGN